MKYSLLSRALHLCSGGLDLCILNKSVYSIQIILLMRVVSLTLFGLDGWMTCDFTSFLTVFQSYQEDVWMIMKGCVQWDSVYG